MPSEADLIEAVDKLGYMASVQSAPLKVEPEPASAPGQMPALIQEALDRARDEEKLVLLDFYAEWCPSCKRLQVETFQDPRVQAELARFVFVKVDTDAHPGVSKHFGVEGIPDTRVLGPDGTELARFVGFKNADAVVAILEAFGE